MKHHPSPLLAIRPGPGLLALALLLAAAGCGGKRTATVSGKVLYRGRPVSRGAIYFHGPGGRMAMAPLQKDGSFTATEVPLAEVKVTVLARDPGVYLNARQGQAPAALVTVPSKYENVNTTDLVFTITGETRDLEVKLE